MINLNYIKGYYSDELSEDGDDEDDFQCIYDEELYDLGLL